MFYFLWIYLFLHTNLTETNLHIQNICSAVLQPFLDFFSAQGKIIWSDVTLVIV